MVFKTRLKDTECSASINVHARPISIRMFSESPSSSATRLRISPQVWTNVQLGMSNYTTMIDSKNRLRVMVDEDTCLSQSKHCFIKTFQSSKAPFIVEDTRPGMNNIPAGGDFCFSRDNAQVKKNQGAILATELSEEYQCKSSGGGTFKWGCLQLNSGPQFGCRKSTSKRFIDDNQCTL